MRSGRRDKWYGKKLPGITYGKQWTACCACGAWLRKARMNRLYISKYPEPLHITGYLCDDCLVKFRDEYGIPQ